MAVVADYPDDPEDDKAKSNAKRLVDITQFDRMMQKRFSLSEHIERISAQVNQIHSAMGLSKAMYDAMPNFSKALAAAMPPISQERLRLEREMASMSWIEASASRMAALGYSETIDKAFLTCQMGIQSQIEACRTAIESVFPMNRDILLNGASQIQAAFGTSKITQDWFRESYSNAIRTISESAFPRQDLMYESVRRVLESESIAYTVAKQWAAQDLSKSFDALGIIDYGGIAFEADLMRRAITPFVREWAGLVCEVNRVSVDISHDEAHLLHAEYDRDTVIELLTARFALEETGPEISISASGNLEQPNDLFECSGEHEAHHAHYDGETILAPKDDSAITKKALSQYLDELRKDGSFDEDEWAEFETDARRAEMFVRENFAGMVHIAFTYLMELSVLYVKDMPIPTEEFRARQEKALAQLRELLPKPDEGRPQGTGLFFDEDDFLTALKDVMRAARKKPSQRETLHALRQHRLCRNPTADYPTQNQTKTLRNWLKRCEVTFKEALERYWKPYQNGK